MNSCVSKLLLVIIIFKYGRNVFLVEKTSMRTGCLLIMVLFALYLVPHGTVCAQNQVKYTVNINSDGSAAWVIKQTGDIEASPDTLVEFQKNVTSLLEDAEHKTQRDMVANVTSITSTVSGSYVATEYRFHWKGFAKAENGSLVVGDVFQTESFFPRLYGDGEVYITYPLQYAIETISPPPYDRNDSLRTVGWLGTKNLVDGSLIIVLKENPQNALDILRQNTIIIVGLLAVVAASIACIYMVKLRTRKERKKASQHLNLQEIESDEEKIVKMLRLSGGSLYQARIVDQCKFSKAKTSQLLAILENKRTVRRYKKGRDKVVILLDKGEKQ